MTHPVVSFIKQSQIRAAFVLATICTCGLAAIPWIIWEIVKKKN